MACRRHPFLWIAAVLLIAGAHPALATDHSGIIDTDECWIAADNPHVINGTVTVSEGRHLLIGAGAEVHSTQYSTLLIEGRLTVDGDPGNEVLFTEGSGQALYAVRFGAAGVGALEHCVIERANAGLVLSSAVCLVELSGTTVQDCYTGIDVYGGTLHLADTTIRNNRGTGLRCRDILPEFMGDGIVLTDNAVGAYFIDVPDLDLTTPLTVRNSTTRGIWMSRCPLPTIDNVTFVGNAGFGALYIESCGDFMLGAGNVIGGVGQENAWPVTIKLGAYPAEGCVIPPSGNQNNGIRVEAGASSMNGVWRQLPGIDFVVAGGEVTIAADGALTIEPGVTIRSEYAYSPRLAVQGSLIAQGAPGQEIRFTRAAAGSWSGIYFDEGGSGSLTHCVIERAVTCVATDGSATGAIFIADTEMRDSSTGLCVQGGSVRLGRTSISVSGGDGIRCEGVVPEFLDGDITIAGGAYGLYVTDVPNVELDIPLVIGGASQAGVYLVNCPDPLIDNLQVRSCVGIHGAFYLDRCGEFTLGPGNLIGGEGHENSWPVTIRGGTYPAADSTIPAAGNVGNGIRIYGGASGGKSGAWRRFPGVDYVLAASPTISAGDSLTVAPGVSVRGINGSALGVEGVLSAPGLAEAPILFTGDPSSWGGVSFRNSGSGILSHARIEYATVGITLGGTGTVTLADCNLYAGATGIRATSGTIALRRTRITGNSEYGIYLGGGLPDFGAGVEEWNEILDNGAGRAARGLRNDAVAIAAPYVWWGSIDPDEIGWSIMDGDDDPNLGIVDFTPCCDAEHQVVGATGVREDDPATAIPTRFGLAPGSPNPFNPATLIRFETTRLSVVRLTIHDIKGRTVATLADEVVAAGRHQRAWNGCDDGGHPVSSGVYFSRIESAEGVVTRKLALVR